MKYLTENGLEMNVYINAFYFGFAYLSVTDSCIT